MEENEPSPLFHLDQMILFFGWKEKNDPRATIKTSLILSLSCPKFMPHKSNVFIDKNHLTWYEIEDKEHI